MKRNRTIVFYLDRLEMGGVERIVLNLIKGMKGKEWTPRLVLNRLEGALLKELPSEVPLHSLNAHHLPSAVLSLARFLKKERPAILVSQRAYLNVIAAAAIQLSGRKTKLVLTEHTLLSEWWKDSRMPQRPIDRLLCGLLPMIGRMADAVVGISQGVARELEKTLKLPRERIHILYNPIIPEDLEEKIVQPIVEPWPKDEIPLILAVGRLSPEKGYDLLLEAFAKLKSEARLAVIGNGPELPRLEELVARLRLSEKVFFLGYQSNPFPWIERADLLALSSVLDSFPTVLVEAMALGKPIVAFDCPHGPGEIIQHGENGLLVPPKDPAALARSMEKVLGDPPLALRLGRGGRLRAQDFRFETTVRAYERLFQNLLDK